MGRFVTSRQAEAVQALSGAGILVKVNMILIPGVNDGEVSEVAERMATLGAKIMNLIPILPVAGTPFGDLVSPGPGPLALARAEAKRFLPQMGHCRRCRADAVGRLDEMMDPLLREALKESASPKERPYVAAASREGLYVNRHLGETTHLAVYRREEDSFHLVEVREAPPTGGGEERWKGLAVTLSDCRALLVSGAGASPVNVLEASGIRVMSIEGLLEDGLEAAFEGKEVPNSMKCSEFKCGLKCSGTGLGCS
jgi:nitrogen fixation protein NifB